MRGMEARSEPHMPRLVVAGWVEATNSAGANEWIQPAQGVNGGCRGRKR
jgi:hypothetical protein